MLVYLRDGGFPGLTMADTQQVGRVWQLLRPCGSMSQHPRLEMRAWKILRELLVFSLQGKPGKERSGVGDRIGELASKSENSQANNTVPLPFSGLEGRGGRYHLHQDGSFLFELI